MEGIPHKLTAVQLYGQKIMEKYMTFLRMLCTILHNVLHDNEEFSWSTEQK